MAKSLPEFDFIDKYLKPLTSSGKAISFNLSDDVALLPAIEGSQIVTSKDLFVENVHFFSSDSPRDIASRLLLSNISDMAAAGATAKYYMLGLPKRDDLMENGFYDEFCAQLALVQDEYGVYLIGGDTVTAKNDLFFSLTIFGEVQSGKLLRRNAAKIGDLIFTTGTIGDSFLGLQYKIDKTKFSRLNPAEVAHILNAHNKPEIPHLFAHELSVNNLSKCAIDISDGLAADLKHICKESKVGAKIDIGDIAISEVAQKLIDNSSYSIEDLIAGGEDYQLLFTTSKDNKNDVFALANRFKISLNCIGEVTSSQNENIQILDIDGKNIKLNSFGYEH